MKQITLITLAVLTCTTFSFSQRLNLNAGTSFSKLYSRSSNTDNFQTLYNLNVGPHIGLHLDYFEQANFFLSSEVYYVQKGGNLDLIFVDAEGNPTGMSAYRYFNYLGVNTNFNYKLDKVFLPQLHSYVFVGPRVDIALSQKVNLNQSLIDDAKFVFGANGGLGLRYDINKISLGFRAQYFQNFNPIFKNEGNSNMVLSKFNDRTFSTQLSVGYNF